MSRAFLDSDEESSRVDQRDFSGISVVKNLPSNAGNTPQISGWGTKIPTCLRATSEPKSPCSLKPQHATTREKPAHHKERFRILQLRPDRAKKKKKKNTPQGKIPHAATKARQSQKKKKKIVVQSVTQSLRGSQVARLGQRCCLLLW